MEPTPSESDKNTQSPDNMTATKSTIANKKRLVSVVAMVFAVLIVVLFLARTNETKNGINIQSANELARKTAQVSITSTGFEPATIKIKTGQSVQWTNDDDAQHQIASDPHPSDDSLPGLKDLPLEYNGSFTFTFETAGKYTYHDENNPLKFNGTILVED